HLPMTVSGGFSEKTADSSVNTEIPEFSLPGSISSQFITGLLLAAPLTGGTKIHLTTPLASASYVNMTIDTMGRFGVHVKKTDDGFEVASGSYRSPGTYMTDGGWSSAAFFIAADVLSAGSAGSVSVTGLRSESLQGDRVIERIADHFYTLKNRGGSNAAFASEKNAGNPDMTIIDAENIPDLVPIIAVLAALTPGRTHIINAARLRLKESDRLRATSEMLSTLGADIVEEPGGLMITGKERLEGGTVSGCNDHRIVMSAAIASIGCRKEVTILGAEAVAKSYPSFWEDFRKLGGAAILFA
ncbi:MAG: 3-phosphoshikimate 1-carboxyvinyltransferase, partial [Lachnospiraceae bacterium]|nr:3-phosphoshikimate 1-carboxyvinyltransferase [Lachnospiraceae bacterium]